MGLEEFLKERKEIRLKKRENKESQDAEKTKKAEEVQKIEKSTLNELTKLQEDVSQKPDFFDILESNNQRVESFKKYFEEQEYKETYNQIFDIMKLIKEQNEKTQESGELLAPCTITFNGKMLTITQEHITNLKKLIESQIVDQNWQKKVEIDFSTMNFEMVDVESQGMISFYPLGTRVIAFSYKDKPGSWYLVFGNENYVQYTLAEWLRDNLKNKKAPWLSKLFQQVPEKIEDNKQEFWDYVGYENKLVLDAHGGPEALKVLFQEESSDIIKYLKEGNNFQQTLDAVLAYSEHTWACFFQIFEWIKGDEELMNVYAKLIVSSQGKYLWPTSDLLYRQGVVTWLLSSFLFDENNKDRNSELSTILLKEKDNLNKVLSVQPTTENKNVIDSIKSQVEEFAKMIVNSPLWAGVITLLDTFFGKGGLMKKLGNTKLAEQLDKQFKEKYAITWDKEYAIHEIYKSYQDKTPIITDISEQNKNTVTNQLATIRENFTTESNDWVHKKVLFDRFTQEKSLLDVHVLDTLFVLENGKRILKTDTEEIDYMDIFVTNSAWETTIKEDVDPIKFEAVLTHVLSDPKIHDIIVTTDMKLKYSGVDYGKDAQKWIQSQADYATFVAAYLMWWSKSDGGSSFHYVITETHMPNEIVQQQPSPEDLAIKQQQENFTKKLAFDWDGEKITKLQLLEDYPKEKMDLTKEPDKTNYPKYQQVITDFYGTHFTNNQEESYTYFSSPAVLDTHKQFFAKHISTYVQLLKEQAKTVSLSADIQSLKNKITWLSSLLTAISIDWTLKEQETKILQEILSQQKFTA